MQYFDLNVKTGKDSLEKLAAFAHKLSFSGIVISDKFRGVGQLEDQKNLIESAKKPENFEIFMGAELQAADRIELRKQISAARNQVHILSVAGGNYHINRAAAEDSRIDVLLHPEKDRMDTGIDEPILNAAAQNNVAIGISLKSMLTSYRRSRSRLFKNLSSTISLCEKFKVKLVICSCAESIWEMRDPREMVSLLNILGADLPKAFSAISETPQFMIEKNKKILAGEKFGEVEFVE